ncbi:Crp/Fnr family transcriptional regulator [Bacteriovorax sp. Seq25_V]|uniref:Crp/Fnr family transcriptional regulator n=1 Tax=Bacteriovorax sp. Seq25_V TaxID=1201288 RepID=UPI000389EB78|nr:Crp/Fnr family transcriptional regulator [Bacteriovorax sp. Seq25_V]EQC44054.1 cyclic nucleotide-binding domain protein [Bacteriovorax sp. Seq25_V]
MFSQFDKNFDLLKLLTKEECQEVTTFNFKKSDIIYNEGDAPLGLYFINKGYIGLTRLSVSGSETLLRVFSPKYFFGHRSLMANEAYHANATALVNSEITFIPKECFSKIIARDNTLLVYIAQILAKELRIAENKFSSLASSKVTARIVQTLAFLRTKYPDYKWTRKEIGEYCGAKTETVSRVLTVLEEQELIKKDGRSIEVIDYERLYLFAQDLEENN